MNKIYLKQLYFKWEEIVNLKRYIKIVKENRYLIILNLHKISNEFNPFYPALKLELFEELLRFVSKEFNVITFKEIDEFKNSVKPNIILSFDDGFYDFLENAVPLLKKYGVSANQNIIPSCIESGFPVWDVKLGDFLNSAPIKTVNEMKLPGFTMKLTESNKMQYGLALTRFLKMRPMQERKELWQIIEKTMQKIDIVFTKMLSLEEIKALAKEFEMGAHSYTHESMGIESDDFFKEDFLKCKHFFMEKLQLPLEIYAFPSGSYKKNQLEYLQDNGVKNILLVDENYSSYDTNIHKRFTFYGNSISEIKMRALGWKR